jgi:hypothetical protein
MIVKVCIAVLPTPSVNWILKTYVPAMLGVPEITPAGELSDRPVASAPANIDQL